MAQFDSANALSFNSPSNSVPITIGNHPNRMLLAFVSNSNTSLGVSGVAVTVGGVTKQMSRKPGFPLHGHGVDITQDVWYLLAPDVGNASVVVTNTSNDSLYMVEVLSAYDVVQSVPNGAVSQALDYGTTTSVTVASTSAADLVVDFDTVSHGGSVTFTNPAPQTNRAQTTSMTYRSSSISTSPGAAGNVAMNSNRNPLPQNDYSYVAFALSDAGSGGGGVTNPTLGTPTVSNITSTGATGSVTTDTGSGTLYWKVSSNPTETVATVEAASAQTVAASGAQTIPISGLTPGTNGLYLHCVQTTTAGGVSSEVNSTAFNTPASQTNNASFTFDGFINNTETGVWANQAVNWVWQQAGRVGSAPTSSTYGTGTISAGGTLTIGSLPAGAGYGLVAKRNTAATDDEIFYQAGTAA